MKVLSIRQPWAWLIINGGKDIENRTWRTNYRGRILVHASKVMTAMEYRDGLSFAQNRCGLMHFGEPRLPMWKDLLLGGVIGSVEIVDCVARSESRWFTGPYGFVLRDPRPLSFVRMAGQLGFFEVEF